MNELTLTTVVFAAGTPILAIFLISRLGGWSQLARAYPRTEPAPKALTRFGYGAFHFWVGYNGGLIVSADETGLFVSTWPLLLSWCHAPVFIPWNHITEARAGRRIGSVYYTLELNDLPGLGFSLRSGTFNRVRPFLVAGGVTVFELS